MANQKDINAKAVDVENLQKRFDTVVLGVFVVVLITALSPLIDAWRFRAASYEALDQRVTDQNQEIEDLTSEIKDLNTALGVKKVIDRDLPSTFEVEKTISVQKK